MTERQKHRIVLYAQFALIFMVVVAGYIFLYGTGGLANAVLGMGL